MECELHRIYVEKERNKKRKFRQQIKTQNIDNMWRIYKTNLNKLQKIQSVKNQNRTTLDNVKNNKNQTVYRKIVKMNISKRKK